MTLYAASDRMWVGISADGHGGCGAPGGHSRPVENGAPAKVWALTCPACEDHLRHDDGWSADLAGIPETYDEKRARESLEKRGERSARDLTALMLARMAGDKQSEMILTELMGRHAADGPTALCGNGHPSPGTAKFCAQCGARVTPAGVVTCPGGHENPEGSQFCAECGQAVRPAALGAPEPPPGTGDAAEHPDSPAPLSAPPGVPWPSNTAMRGMKREELATVAAGHGQDATGNRADLLGRLIAAANAERA